MSTRDAISRRERIRYAYLQQYILALADGSSEERIAKLHKKAKKILRAQKNTLSGFRGVRGYQEHTGWHRRPAAGSGLLDILRQRLRTASLSSYYLRSFPTRTQLGIAPHGKTRKRIQMHWRSLL